jgi:hypothetical protein
MLIDGNTVGVATYLKSDNFLKRDEMLIRAQEFPMQILRQFANGILISREAILVAHHFLWIAPQGQTIHATMLEPEVV